MLNKYNEYLEVKKQYDVLKKQLDTLKNEIIADLSKNCECTFEDDKLIYTDGVGKLTISENNTLKAAAWNLVNASPDPSQYINYGLRRNLTVKH